MHISFRLKPSTASIKIDVPFRETVCALMHLTTTTQPDIGFAVGYVSRFIETHMSSTGWRSCVFYDICKELSRMEFASHQPTN